MIMMKYMKLKNKKTKINNILIEKYIDMLKNPNFEQNKYSITSTGIYKIAHDSIRLMKWICYYDRSYFENINYYDLQVFVNIQMKYLNGEYFVEVRDHRYKTHPTENIISRKKDPPTSLRTQYQVQNETKIRRNQKVIKNDNDQLIVKNYHKNENKQPTIQHQLPNCPSCKRNNWLEFEKGYYCKNCE